MFVVCIVATTLQLAILYIFTIPHKNSHNRYCKTPPVKLSSWHLGLIYTWHTFIGVKLNLKIKIKTLI